jgi:hypothetical protein
LYCIFDDGNIGFTVQSRSRKVENFERDARVTVMVDAGTGHGELRGVQIAGRAILDRSSATVLDIHQRIATRYPTKAATDITRTMAKRVAVLVEPTRVPPDGSGK